MNTRYLPIGSIVLLRGGAKKLMVVGYFGVNPDGEQVDYMGVVYPEGYLDYKEIIGFNRVEVQEILFEGYKDIEQNNLFVQLDAYANGRVAEQTATVPFTDKVQYNQTQTQIPNQNPNMPNNNINQ